MAAKCFALLHGKFSPDIEDVQAVALSVLRHRVSLSYKAEADGISLQSFVEEVTRQAKS